MNIKTLFRYDENKIVKDSIIESENNDIVVTISPLKDQFNDFGYRVKCYFEILKPQKFKAVIYLAIKSKENLLKDPSTTTEFIDFNKFIEVSQSAGSE